MSIDKQELLNCPFCGSDDISSGEAMITHKHDADAIYKQTGCLSCGALGSEAKESDIYGRECDKAWNARAPLQAARQSAQEPVYEPVYFLLTSANQYCEVDKLVHEMAKPEYRRKLYTKLEGVYDQAIAKAQNRPLADVFEEYEAMLEQAVAK